MTQENKGYAYLPEDLLVQILGKIPETADRLATSIELNNEQATAARRVLKERDLIRVCPDGNHTESMMAADGACIVEHKTSADILLAIAVGVDGLSDEDSSTWPEGERQYQHWQAVLPHHVANPRLSQGIMFLMELSILAGNDREVKIMDGSHLTSILKLNSLLSANDQDAADQPYVQALSDFLHENYEKVIPDIPNIIRDAFSDSAVVGLTKYSSSREIIDTVLRETQIDMDDKVFMSIVLNENEYTKPLTVGQCRKERGMWKNVHMKCNLEIEGVDNDSELNPCLEEAIAPFKITDNHESELYFCYYKPNSYSSAHRIEIKQELALDSGKLEKMFRSVKRQIISPEIREPYPQYLADIIAKNISFGMEAINQAISHNPTLNTQKNFDLIFPYRTN
ncbi:MAG: DNA double-strand break repair nuclease NurA [Gammaproteobacteria bacterium]|nr:DNA double-strand break repair nuclease NurA [Gammaproteobacteria bacterium]